jgi:hypothetical protein
MDGVLLEVRNRKERCCDWSLVATTSHIATLGVLAFKIGLTLSLLGYSEALTLQLSTARIASISNRVISWMSVHVRPMLLWFRKCLLVPVLP